MDNIDQSDLQVLLPESLDYASSRGADSAEIMASNDKGYSVTARLGDVETCEHHNQRAMAVTVYRGQAKGSASSNDLRPEAIQRTIDAALNIAKFTAQDECAGLADAQLMANNYPQLELDHPWDMDAERALEKAIACEAAARDHADIVNSEGATVSSIRSHMIYANTHGFLGQYASTRHSLSCSVVAGDASGMQRDYWYSVNRRGEQLDAEHYVGQQARDRSVRRLSARGLKTCQIPVLFEPRIARSIIGHFFSAIRGSAIYRDSSFLVDAIGNTIFPDWLTIKEDPHVPGGLASAPFDNEGVSTQPRNIVENGILQGYLLNSYAARKLNMRTTANAGGMHNIHLNHSAKSFDELLAELNTGLLVTELIGHGVNPVTGDYSRGASGFWVENGEIQYPVQEITIAGNLADMFKNIAALGSDVDTCGSIQCGSILLDNLTVAGA